MKNPNDVIIRELNLSKGLLHMFCDDLKEHEYLFRPHKEVNCVAWTLGHLILSERRVLTALGQSVAELPDKFEERFGRENDAPRSDHYGDTSILIPLFDQYRNQLIEITAGLSIDKLNEKLENPLPIFSTQGERIHFMAFHVTMHMGQISVIRRFLGRPPVV